MRSEQHLRLCAEAIWSVEQGVKCPDEIHDDEEMERPRIKILVFYGKNEPMSCLKTIPMMNFHYKNVNYVLSSRTYLLLLRVFDEDELEELLDAERRRRFGDGPDLSTILYL
jgi:hypothetical protein